MDTTNLFSTALGLQEPWFVGSAVFEPGANDSARGSLELGLDFAPGGTFACPTCGTACSVHDTRERQWRHLDFFQHECLLTARCPRVRCGEHGVLTADLPWEGTGYNFTALFEAFALEMARHMPVARVAQMLRIPDQTLWNLLNRHVSRAREDLDLSEVDTVGVDEKHIGRRVGYVSVFAELGKDPGGSRVLEVVLGRDAGVFAGFVKHLEAHGGSAKQIREVAMDMSTGYRKGTEECLPKAEITYDHFHVIKLANAVVDEVRREEVQYNAALKKTRYAWLKNPDNLTAKQRTLVEDPSLLRTATGRAYQLKQTLADLYHCPPDHVKTDLNWIIKLMLNSGIAAVIRLGKTLALYRRGVLRYFKTKATTGYLEGINSLIQAALSKARGYRSFNNLATIVYLIAGKLRLDTKPFSTH